MAVELTGVVHEGTYISEKYKNAHFDYLVHIPEEAAGKKDLGLIVTHDGLNREEAYAAEILAHRGEAPWCVTIGIVPGVLPATVENGTCRGLRMINYDINSSAYPEFVVDELIPYLTEKYGLSISDSPDMHLVSGGSSGGMSAWNIAWCKPDYFHRVYMSSPSLWSFGKGEELIHLMRKCETKPIRVFTDYCEQEFDEYCGSGYCAGIEAKMALEYAGYEMEWRYYPGEWHCSRLWNAESALERLQFLWKDWETTPVTVKKRSPRVDKVVPMDSKWEETQEQFPEKILAASNGNYTATGTYVAGASRIIFVNADGERSIAAEGFEEISSLVISSDKWRLYIGDKKRGCIYAATIEKDGSLNGVYVLCALHMKTDFRMPGVLDLCVDSEDRLYAATETGIQVVRPFGIVDVILDNPAGKIADQLEIGEDGYLYAHAAGKTYKRKLLNARRTAYDTQTPPVCMEYFN